MSQHTIEVREETVKELIKSYIKTVNMKIFKNNSGVFRYDWVKKTISKHVEVFDIIETHDIELSEVIDNMLHSNLNFLRAQINVEEYV